MAFEQQVLHYRIRTSLFDIVVSIIYKYQIFYSLLIFFYLQMAAVCRFALLLIFYALLHLNHWLIVAVSILIDQNLYNKTPNIIVYLILQLTTALTCAFLGAKAYFFNVGYVAVNKTFNNSLKVLFIFSYFLIICYSGLKLLNLASKLY